MADLFAPCFDYQPDSPLPVEACCTSCTHLDDDEACPELCRRFREAEGKEAIPSVPFPCLSVSGESGGEGGK